MVVINKLEIVSFGGVKNRDISLSEGVNVISAPNEWGKTTVAAFIKFVFYGLPKLRGKKTISEYERARYLPWDGSPLAGGCEFTRDGVRYRLSRLCTERRENVNFCAAESGEEISTAGLTPGEFVFGLDSGSAARTILTLQSDIAVSEHGELETKIRNLVTSGDEDVSYDNACAALSDAVRKYRHRGRSTGGLADLSAEVLQEEQEYDRSIAQYDEFVAAELKLRACERRCAENEQRCEELTSKIGESEAADAKRRVERIDEISAATAASLADIAEKRVQLCGFRGEDFAKFSDEIKNYSLLLSECERCEAQSERLLEEQKEEGKEEAFEAPAPLPQKKESPLFFIVLAITALLGICAGVLFAMGNTPFAVALLCVTLLCGGASLLLFVKRAKRAEAFNAELQRAQLLEMKAAQLRSLRAEERARGEAQRAALEAELLEAKRLAREKLSFCENKIAAALEIFSLPFTDIFEAQHFADSLAKRLLALQKAEDEFALLSERLKAAGGGERERLAALAANFSGEAMMPPEQLREELSRGYAQKSELSRLAKLAESEIARLNSECRLPILVEESLAVKRAALAAARTEDAALTLAGELLDEAFEVVQNRFAPELNSKVGEYFSKITGGKYGRLQIDHKYNMRIFGEGDFRDIGYFSAGTRDAAYIALRLAVTGLLYGKELPPAVFDDSFTRLDEERLSNLVALLREDVKRQYIIFSCTAREEQKLGCAL